MNRPEIIVCKDAEGVARQGAERFGNIARYAISRTGRFVVALSGGNTPRAVNVYLAHHYRDLLDWSRIFLFWGDERAVPPDHVDSNYRMARESLIDRVPIPSINVSRVRAETSPPEAARQYETELRNFFKQGRGFPVFDLIFLGMGDDGHTASLFPGTPALLEKDRWVVENSVQKLNTERITFTAPLINQAEEVIFLVCGAAKASALKQVLEGAFDPDTYPSQLVRPRGRLVWLVDQGAAAQLACGEQT
jgi:6-phosphogluconolactonase